VWPETTPPVGRDGDSATALLHRLEDRLGALPAADPAQQQLIEHARLTLRDLLDASWDVSPQVGPYISPWITVALVFWLMLTFASLGIAAPRTPLIMGTLFLCAAALAGAVFLMV